METDPALAVRWRVVVERGQVHLPLACTALGRPEVRTTEELLTGIDRGGVCGCVQDLALEVFVEAAHSPTSPTMRLCGAPAETAGAAVRVAFGMLAGVASGPGGRVVIVDDALGWWLMAVGAVVLDVAFDERNAASGLAGRVAELWRPGSGTQGLHAAYAGMLR